MRLKVLQKPKGEEDSASNSFPKELEKELWIADPLSPPQPGL